LVGNAKVRRNLEEISADSRKTVIIIRRIRKKLRLDDVACICTVQDRVIGQTVFDTVTKRRVPQQTKYFSNICFQSQGFESSEAVMPFNCTNFMLQQKRLCDLSSFYGQRKPDTTTLVYYPIIQTVLGSDTVTINLTFRHWNFLLNFSTPCI
jgi:hypothetical protein